MSLSSACQWQALCAVIAHAAEDGLEASGAQAVTATLTASCLLSQLQREATIHQTQVFSRAVLHHPTNTTGDAGILLLLWVKLQDPGTQEHLDEKCSPHQHLSPRMFLHFFVQFGHKQVPNYLPRERALVQIKITVSSIRGMCGALSCGLHVFVLGYVLMTQTWKSSLALPVVA